MVHIEDLVSYTIIAAMGIAVLLLVTGKFIDLTVEKQTFTQTRSTINLLQKIVTDGPILVKDPEGNPKKLMIDKAAYASADLSECCDSVQYDYEFKVGEFDGQSVVSPSQVYYTAGSIGTKTNVFSKSGGESRPYTTKDQCYYEFRIGNARGAKVPVNICEKDLNENYLCTQGVAGLETRDTPLSQLSSWMTQVCASKFETSKRIPLARKDYQTGYDITIEKDSKGDSFICLDGNCKRFECPLGVETRTDQTLLDNRMGLYDYFTCNFVVISKKDNKVIVYEGYDEAEGAAGVKNFPEDEDQLTEKETGFYTVQKFRDFLSFTDEDAFEVTNGKISSRDASGSDKEIDAAKGDNYVTFKVKDSFTKTKTIRNYAMYLNIDMLSKSFPGIESLLGCDGKCVEMQKDGKAIFTSIMYKARITSNSDTRKNIVGSLTWKLYDTDGKCIEKRFGDDWTKLEFGQNKNVVRNLDWQQLSIKYLPDNQIGNDYKNCDNNSDQVKFNWKIGKIEWNVCERSVRELAGVIEIEPACSVFAQEDSINALMIDNFYFKAGDAVPQTTEVTGNSK